MWGVQGRALSPPRLPALWAGCRGPLPTGCGCGGCGLGDPSPTPQRALLRAGFAHCGGGTRAPGGGSSCLGVGRPGSGALPPPTARSLGRFPGPTTRWLWVRGGAGVGTRHQPHSARSWVLWGRHGGARGGRLLPWCGASGVGRSPTPDCPPSGRAAGAHYPLAVGAGGCGRGDPSPTPQRGLLRAGFAHCGSPPAWVWGVRGRALSQPRLPALWAGCRGPLPTCCGCGGVRAWGPVTNATARSCVLWKRHEGAWGGRLLPGRGASGVGRSPTPDCPPSGRAAGDHYPLAVGAGGLRAWGPVTNPTARALASWLCALWGRHEGAREGRLLPGCGASGVGRSPTPDRPPFWRAAGAHYLLAVGAGGAGVGTRHQPHSARSCVLPGRHEGARGGALLPGCGGSGVGRSPTPGCTPSGRAAGAHYPLAVGAGGLQAWGPVTNPTARALASWLCALWGRHEGAREGRLLPGCGASGVGRSPSPDCPPSGRAAGAHYPLAAGAGGCGCGDPSPTPQPPLLRAGFARCGGGMRLPGGGASCLGVGRLGSGALPTPTARPLGRLPGPTTLSLWVRGGAGVGTRHQRHSARSCVLWGRHEGARGGRLLLGRGASGVGRSPTPDCPPSGWVAGVHYPLAVGAGGCGRGDPSPTPQRALLRAVGAA